MELIDNINKTLAADLKNTINPKSKISLAAGCFSIYAFEELKEELKNIEELRFIFISPAFTSQKEQNKNGSINNSEQSLFGTIFETKLKNKLSQKAIAKECAEWIKQKVVFKSNNSNDNMMGFLNVDENNYMPVNGFSTIDLGCERGNNAFNVIQKTEAPISQEYLKIFNELWNNPKYEDVTANVIERIKALYSENSPDLIYFITIYNLFNDFLSELNDDFLPKEGLGFKKTAIWNKLYNFQKDACIHIIKRLNQYNGCILADSVGLGKTFTALAVIKYYEQRNYRVLVLCPKKLANNWNVYKSNYKNNPLAEDKLRYDVLFHTDLNRKQGQSNGIDLALLDWGVYDLVVIDESHNFRNGLSTNPENKENRYSILLNKVIKQGVKTKVLMLSATPVNNRFLDLKNQLALAYEGVPQNLDERLGLDTPINSIFKQAQNAFTRWSKLDIEERTTENLLNLLNFDFFKLLDRVTIARSRKHIQAYYDTKEIGTFPKRLPPISIRSLLSDSQKNISYSSIHNLLCCLNLCIYVPSMFIIRCYRPKYDLDDKATGFDQMGRELGIRRLMAINLLKRLESSFFSFRKTIGNVKEYINTTIDTINRFIENKKQEDQSINIVDFISDQDIDDDDQNEIENYIIGKKIPIELKHMDYMSWLKYLTKDVEVLNKIEDLISEINPENDLKLQQLKDLITDKIKNPINKNNKKVIIFTAFADTAVYLYDIISKYFKQNYNMDSAMVSGSISGKCTLENFKGDLNTILTYFSPLSKDKDLIYPNDDRTIDILIATDCISEGQNLQDCDYLINYDIHWNPVRIIQRFGRIDRIGSRNSVIQLVNFWPDVSLDEYIHLTARVETRMKIVDMSATADDNILEEEQKDLEYRKEQLQKLQTEVVDLEDMNSNISIMDLGLNEFKMDLLNYKDQWNNFDLLPHGIYTVVNKTPECPEGIIFILKNLSDSSALKTQNILHPYYMVYIKDNGDIQYNHMESKKILNSIRVLCKGMNEPDNNICNIFNKETEDGNNMTHCSDLLSKAINSIIDTKEKSDIDSLFKNGGTSINSFNIKGLNDFELICFIVVR